MKTQYVVVIALAALAGAASAPAHEVDPDGKINVACASDTVRMGAIRSAVESNHYWAPQSTRREMLTLAQQACARGATLVTFVPPADQPVCRASPTRPTLCLDRTASARNAADGSGKIVQ